MEKIEKESQLGETDSLDCTGADEYDEDDEKYKIRISNGINLRELNTEGIVFHPEIEEEDPYRTFNHGDYFQNHLDELEAMLAVTTPADREARSDERSKLPVDISGGQGGVLKQVLEEGVQTGGTVPDKATVTIHYTLRVEEQDEPFDSSVLRGRSEKHQLGVGKLIEGLEMGIYTMKRQEKASFVIDWKYAYGGQGCPPRIPAKSVIFATVELLDFVDESQADALLSLEPDERNAKHGFRRVFEICRLEHRNGNAFVKQEEWKMAYRSYERASKLIDDVSLANEDEQIKRQDMQIKLYLNKAHCCIKLKWPKKACIACKEVLAMDEDNTKALYRFGAAKMMLEDYDGAKRLLLKAQRRRPEDKEINDRLKALEDKLEEDQKHEAQLYQNMFSLHKRKKNEEDAMDKEFYEIYVEELEAFKLQGGEATELCLPHEFTEPQVMAIEAAARVHEMDVKVENVKNGSRVMKISKK